MQLVETKASKPTYQQLKEGLAVERLNHLSSVLNYKWDIDNLGMKSVNGDFAIFEICEDCGNPHILLCRYSLEEVLSLDAEIEANRLMEEVE